ncbi:adenylate/guanylate cyclase domain-containing protein [Falsiruegeria mediterranea]|jgi:adenylate cyclase
MSDRIQRKLASVVAADIVGYSRLMAENEAGTIEAVHELKSQLVEPVVAQHDGRIVKTMGDGFLLEFSSVLESVEASVALQERLKTHDFRSLGGLSIELRIGVHVGDIVIQEGDIFGGGVNIAARIEPLVAPGGIGISDEAHGHIRDKLDLDWADGGAHDLKNIPRPVRIWYWRDGPIPSSLAPEPDLQLPELPSVAVLPFDNMSSDKEQEYFADGLTEDLITDLSKISGLFVVARNSTFVFKGKSVDIPTVGRTLGVANVVEGSVRRLGDRVRINVQLIDAKTGGHIWADRYDGGLEAVFELQDQVCREVVSALSVNLTQVETERLNKVHTTNIDAYEVFVRAKSTPYPPIPSRLKAAGALFEQVVEMAPAFAGGYAGLSWIIGFGALWGHSDPDVLGARAEALAYKAIAVDEGFGWSYTVLGVSLLAQRRFDEAEAAARRGVELLPNDADANVIFAVLNAMRGKFDVAIKAAETAFRLSPNFVSGPYLNVISHANFMAGNYQAALAAYERNVNRGGPVGPPAYCWAAAAYHATGQADAARQAVQELTARFPDFGQAKWNFLQLIEAEELRQRTEALFRDAGIPD